MLQATTTTLVTSTTSILTTLLPILALSTLAADGTFCSNIVRISVSVISTAASTATFRRTFEGRVHCCRRITWRATLLPLSTFAPALLGTLTQRPSRLLLLVIMQSVPSDQSLNRLANSGPFTLRTRSNPVDYVTQSKTGQLRGQ
jgi:hypothetical protein